MDGHHSPQNQPYREFSKMPNSQDLASIIESSWVNIIEFKYYKNSDHKWHDYKVEVYAVDPNLNHFFGWDLNEKKTKKFIIDNVGEVTKLENFVPRFPRP